MNAGDGLERDLEELEAADPAVRRAADRLGEVIAVIAGRAGSAAGDELGEVDLVPDPVTRTFLLPCPRAVPGSRDCGRAGCPRCSPVG